MCVGTAEIIPKELPVLAHLLAGTNSWNQMGFCDLRQKPSGQGIPMQEHLHDHSSLDFKHETRPELTGPHKMVRSHSFSDALASVMLLLHSCIGLLEDVLSCIPCSSHRHTRPSLKLRLAESMLGLHTGKRP